MALQSLNCDASLMKVRIGYGPGIGHASASASGSAASSTTSRSSGFDSLWLPERLAGPSTDPLVGLAFAAGRTKKLKLGHERAGAAWPEPRRARKGARVARRACRVAASCRRSDSA